LLVMGEGMVERFKREARTAAALSHPHIIPIFAVKDSHRIIYFVMKYVQGRPLDAVIHDVERLPIPMVQAILAQVGDALGYAHRHGVVHRDIKSANIMIDEEGWAVVTDFGIAKVQETQGLTLTGVAVGTPAYMSPEQCATREVTGASDQYSLGVVAYEMLTGRLPFQSVSSMSMMYAHFNEQAPSVTELRTDCPPHLASAVMRMLEKEPEDRWPTMDDVIAVCGRPSPRRDDPIRSEMITLAKSGPARLLAEMHVPTSPIALAKSRRRHPAVPPHRSAWRWRGLGAAGLAVALWFAAPWRLLRAPVLTPVDTVVAPQPAAPLVADTAATRIAARAIPPALLEALSAAAESVLRAAAVRQEDGLVRSLRTAALAGKRRAVEAGATPNEMARGDTLVRGAESLAANGRLTDAMVQFVTARSLWSEAERVARDRKVALASPVGPLPVDPRVSIERAVAEYARALESRDTGQVRRAYPGLTAAQQQGWGEFFRAVTNFKTSLSATRIDVTGGTAEAIVSGVFEYVNAAAMRFEQLPVTFQASLVSEPTGWRLSTIH